MSSAYGRVDKSPGVIARSPWWMPWVFLAVFAVGWVAFTQTSIGGVAETNRDARIAIREAQVDSCERVNALRDEMNERATIMREHLAATSAVLLAADMHDEAARFTTLSARIQDTEIVECERAFPEDAITAGVGQWTP